ncbi:hypothetical protein [Catellatospora sp. NPDC049609]|uniref:hypothetical protein n=1 Tax=Catellatospora sp. NPDC049609 TaxID=3155505 RepID=UPI0034252B66
MPYQDDLEAALQRARWDAYDRGAFYRGEPDTRAQSMSEQEYVAWMVAEQRASIVEAFGEDAWEPDDTMARDSWRCAQIMVCDPDTLLESQPFSGTHSVIDMTGVADEPAPGMVAPVPPEILDEVFGTRRPSDALVAQAVAEYTLDDFGRWHGAYVVAYDGDVPAAVHFFGHSGD